MFLHIQGTDLHAPFEPYIVIPSYDPRLTVLLTSTRNFMHGIRCEISAITAKDLRIILSLQDSEHPCHFK